MALKSRKKAIYSEPEVEVKVETEAEAVVEEEIPAEENVLGYKVQVIADRLRMRKAPSVEAEVVGLIQDKGIYRIIREENGFGQIKCGAWIMLKYTQEI